jgi:hypothetical protein
VLWWRRRSRARAQCVVRATARGHQATNARQLAQPWPSVTATHTSCQLRRPRAAVTDARLGSRRPARRRSGELPAWDVQADDRTVYSVILCV